MFCKECGAKIEEGAERCTGCGKEIGGAGIRNETQLQSTLFEERMESETSLDSGPIHAQLKLTKCKVCGHALSVEAEICPSCGQKTEWGWEREHRAETLRKTEQIKSELLQALESRKKRHFNETVAELIIFCLGAYLTTDPEWTVIGLFLIVVTIIMTFFEIIAYNVRMGRLKKQLKNLQNGIMMTQL